MILVEQIGIEYSITNGLPINIKLVLLFYKLTLSMNYVWSIVNPYKYKELCSVLLFYIINLKFIIHFLHYQLIELNILLIIMPIKKPMTGASQP